ncbi:hypothetical protein N9V13_01555 [Betaproteobacteria bacterium]|nr:hypothetical protein [Betaproteobacteria bacterium]
MTFDDFSQVEIKNVGIELAKAREAFNKTSTDFVLDLRTTKHHINAIEEGELRIFYGPPFYLDLLRRYALALNFSELKIKELERRVTNQEAQDEEKDAPADEKIAVGNSGESSSQIHTKPASGNARKSKIFSRYTPMSYSQLRMEHQEKNKLLEKNRILLRYAYGLVLLAVTAVYFLDNRASLSDEKIGSNSGSPTSMTQKKSEFISSETANEKDIYESQQYADLLNEISESVNNSNENLSNKKLEFDEFKPFIVAKDINPEMLGIDEDVPNVIFDVRSTTWLWIKFADQSVNEFVVKENEKVLIEKYPIYVVVGDPENVFLWIKGEKYSIEANDPERNIARFTRSQLLQFTN